MNLEEFERQVLAGEINDYNTDFEAYFEQVDNEDKISAMRKICIENNVYQEKYREWADELTARGLERFIIREKYNGKLPKILFDDYYNNTKQGFYFDDNIDVASYYPTIITDLMKGN